MSAKQRIPYIDFMKGLCIILIVGFHVSPDLYPGNTNSVMQAFRIPMYYFLSGLFFKPYDSSKEFLRRKTNNILVPFVFFYLMACALAILQWLMGKTTGQGWEWSYLLDPFTCRNYHYNMVLWFLLSLFEVNVINYVIKRWLPVWGELAAVVALSALGWWLGTEEIQLPMMLDTALVALPYFTLGSYVRKRGGLNKSANDKWGLAVFPVLLVALYFIATEINIEEQVLPSYFVLYGVPFVSILALLWFSKNLGNVPVVGYIGRYSIVVLGTHAMFVGTVRDTMIKLLGDNITALVAAFAIMIAMELVVIPVMIRLFPRFTAQKPLIK